VALVRGRPLPAVLAVLVVLHALHGLHLVEPVAGGYVAVHAAHHAVDAGRAVLGAVASATHCAWEAIAPPGRGPTVWVTVALTALVVLATPPGGLPLRPGAPACRSGPRERRALLQVFLV
jgi:hypothetical protein